MHSQTKILSLIAFAFATVATVAAAQQTQHARTSAAANQAAAVNAPLSDVTALMQCIARETTEMNRLRELAVAAERQNRQARDAAARADARTAVDSLKRQIWARQEQMALCFQTNRPLPFENTETPTATAAPTPTAAPTSAERVAAHGPSLHVVEGERNLGQQLRVVRAVRIDGVDGAIADDAVRTAVNGVAPALESCVRSSAQVRGSQLALEFEINSSGRVVAIQTVERVGSSPETARCFESTLRNLYVASARGRSAYGYTFGLGAN